MKTILQKKLTLSAPQILITALALCFGFNPLASHAQCFSTVSFSNTNYSTVSTQQGAVGDVNGDGKLDLIVPSGGLFVLLNNGTGGFGAATSTGVSSLNSDVAAAVADFNNDGKADIAVVNQGNGTVTVYQGNGNGTFVATAVATLTVGSTPTAIFVGDFNGDNKPDIAVSNYSSNTVSVFLNNQTGTSFSFGGVNTLLTVGTQPRFVFGADLNGDGKIDLVSANGGGGATGVSVFINNGTGGFGAATNYTAGSTPYGVALADFNGDGKPDLAIANSGGTNLSIFINNGTGGFGAATSVAVGTHPYSVIAGDFNNDGIMDLASANFGSANVSILLGNGTGGFTAALTPGVGTSPYSIFPGDFNTDGRLDFATFNSSNASVSLNTTATASISVLQACTSGLSLTAGTVAGATYAWSGPSSYTGTGQTINVASPTAGVYSLTVTTSGPCTASTSIPVTLQSAPTATASAPSSACSNGILSLTGGPSGMTTYTWTGPNSFTSSIQSPGIYHPTTAAAGTYTLTVKNSSGCTASAPTSPVSTITTGTNTSHTYTICAGQSITPHSNTYKTTGTYVDDAGSCIIDTTKLTVYFGTGGAPVFPASPPSINASARPQMGSAVDVNSDGIIDLIVPDANGSTVKVMLGIGNGTFGSINSFTAGSNPVSTTVADFTGDGVMDIAAANQGSTNVTVYKGNNDGSFVATALSTLPVGSTPTSVTSGDFNRDGKQDLAVSCYGSNNVYIFLGNGDGTFTAAPTPTVTVGSNPRFVTNADLNGDGILDLAIANQTGGVTILKGDGTGSFTAASVSPLTAGTTCYGIAIADFNGDGKPDLAVSNDGSANVSVFINNGSGSPTFTFSFTVPVGSPYTVGTNPQSIIAADFNGDGIQDLATSNYGNPSSTAVSVLTGTGTGTFSSATNFSGGTTPYSMGAADFNGDGEPDIVTYNNVTASSATILINATPGISATAGATTPVCPGGTLNLTGGPSGASSYSWTGPSGFTSTLQSPAIPSVTTAAAGIYSLTVTVVAGCTSSANTPSVVVSSLVATANAVTPVCTNGTLSLTGGPAGMTSYLWAGPNSFSSSIQSPTVSNPSTSAAGVYTLTITSSAGCSATASTGAVTVNAAPAPVSQTFTLCGGQSVTVGSVTHNLTGTYTDNLTAHNGCDSVVTTKLTVYFGTGGAPVFPASPPSINASARPQQGSAADVNSDGIIDLIVPDANGSTIKVMLGIGNGTFGSINSFSSGNNPVSTTVADFTSDGVMDMAVANQGSTNVTVYKGNNNGTFVATALATLTVGSTPTSITSADFNGDGKQDLAVSCYGSNNVYIFLGNGDGTFAAAPTPTVAVGSNPRFVTSADLNGDGFPDLAIANQTGGVTILKGNGAGSFTAASVSPLTAGTTCYGIAIADFNGDGKPDLAVSNDGSANVSVFINNGSGSPTFTFSFTIPVGSPYSVGTNPQSIVAADFNGDGILDLATTNYGNPASTSVSILLGTGTGTFGTATNFAGGTTPYSIATADFNGDGEPDVVTYNNVTASSATILLNATPGSTASASATTPVCSSGATNSTLNLTGPAGGATYSWSGPNGFTSSVQSPAINNPSTLAAGVYSLTVTSSHGCTSTASTASVVVNAPSAPVTQTIVACSSYTVGSNVHTTSGTYTDVITNTKGCDSSVTTHLTINQPSVFAQTVTICAGQNIKVGSKSHTATGTYIDKLAEGAANGCDSTVTTNLTVFFNTGNQTFPASPSSNIGVGSSPQSIVTADFNGDGIPDWATSNQSSSGTVSVFLGNGSGGFTSATGSPFSVGTSPYSISTGDFNGDGKPDLATVNSGTVSVLIGNGTGGFAPAIFTTAGNGAQLGTAVDLNGDGKADFLVPNGSGSNVTVLIGNGTGGFSTSYSVTVGSNPVSVAVADFNGDGKLDMAAANQGAASVSIILGNGNGTFGTALPGVPIVGSTPTCITAGDFNADGKVDLAVSNYGSNTVSVLLGNGNGTFQTKVDYTVGTNPRFVGVAYINGDGIPDLVVANQGGNASVLVGNGDGTFHTTAGIVAGTGPYGIAAADFNGDGKIDMAVVNRTSGNVSIELNSTPTQLPTILPTATPGSICLNDNSTISVSGASTYTWAPSTGLSLTTGASVSASPAVNTTYTVTGTDVHGCMNTSTATITLKAPVPLAVNPQSAVCTGQTNAVLAASGAATYVWAPTGNLTPSTGTSSTETAQISQLTFYTVTATGADGCTANTVIPVATVATGGAISPAYSIICSGGTKTLTVTGAAGHDYQWQISTDDVNWSNITGATNTTYTTASGDGNNNKYYRLMAQSNSCWNVASTTGEVDISNPNIVVTATNVTDNSLTLSWSPTGTGNYSISYSGPSSATFTSVTPAKTITGLTANGTYSITVTQTGVSGCPASGTLTGVNTLCAMPTGVTLSSPAPSQILVSWSGVVGADYRVYYRPLFSYNTYFTKDVSNVSSVLLTKQGANNLYASTTYEVYVSRLDCPTTGATGQGTNPTNVTTLPTVTCATPQIDSVRSLCPVQIEVFIHDNGVNQYNVFIQRITPSILAVNSYGVSGTYFTINTPYSGDQYLIAVEAKCGSALSATYVWPGNVTVKPLCTSPSNLVLSNPTCHGFTASWNSDQCLSNSASSYDIYLRVAGTINYNSYGVPLPANGIGPNKLINFVTSGRSYQVFVRSVYNCNGFATYGPASQTETITTLSSGCRDEDAEQPQENKPATQQYSPDNSEVFSLYPNPNTGKFIVDLSRLNMEEDAVRIEVINMLGQTVMTDLTSISGGHMSEYINLPNGTAAGTYIVRLTAGKNVYTTKINISK